MFPEGATRFLTMSDNTVSGDDRRLVLRAERAAAAPYWGGFESRIVVEFLISTVAYATSRLHERP